MHGWMLVCLLIVEVGAVYVASVVLYKNDGVNWSLFLVYESVHVLPLILMIDRGI